MNAKNEEYSLKQSLRSFIQLLDYSRKKKKSALTAGILYFPAYIAVSILQIYLPKAVLSELENKQTVSHFMVTLTAISIPLFAALFFRDKCTVKIQNDGQLIAQEMNFEYDQKFLYVEYPFLADPEFTARRDNARIALFGRGRDSDAPTLWGFLPVLNSMAASFGTALVYAVMISRLSPILAAAVLATSFGTMWFSLRDKNINPEVLKTAGNALRKYEYISSQAGNFSHAKDIRLYHMNDWLLNTAAVFRKIRLHCKAIMLKQSAGVQLAAAAFMGIQNLIVYAFLLTGIYKSEISLSDFILYAGVSAALSNAFVKWAQQMHQLHRLSIDYGKFRDFIAYGNDEEWKTLPLKKEKASIILENVSFRFPGMEKNLLQNLNFTVNYGEKLAVVGINGAGKTTLMKLICGLLTPTEGRILLNGKDISEIPPHERHTWFSCAFQDITFLPVTIAENISMQSLEETDETKVWSCLARAGMKEKIEAIPGSIHAFMEKDINEEAVDFSGGERQKLILARALYRDASVLILDEPTAALDPLAENDIYLKYAAFSENKTSFFVSHRLSSTRFCDRILLLNNGTVEEEGTHDELLKLNGLYAQMFTLQSHYYREKHSYRE